MAKPTSMTGKVGVAYNINTINSLAMKSGQKPLTPDQLKGMTKAEVKAWIRQVSKVNAMNRRDRRSSSRTFRKNARAVASENLKQAQLMHGTIRQGLAELGTLGTEAIGGHLGVQYASNAIKQNTNGGTVENPGKDDDSGDQHLPEDGPINKGAKRYSYSGRKEG